MGDSPVSDRQRADESLLVAARSDPDAFGEFYRRHVDMVLGYFYRRTGCAQTSADLTAETFAQALASLDRYRPTGAPGSAWLVGVARNQLRYYLRRRRVADRARRRLGMSTEVAVDDAQVERIEERFDAELRHEKLADAWGALTPNLADAVRLRVVDELAYADIAEQLACSEGAARVRVARGLSRLAEAMGTA